jgi:hypothetical protein
MGSERQSACLKPFIEEGLSLSLSLTHTHTRVNVPFRCDDDEFHQVYPTAPRVCERLGSVAYRHQLPVSAMQTMTIYDVLLPVVGEL